LPRDYITGDGFGITAKARRYLSPLVRGEDFPPFKDGLPRYVRLKNVAVPKKLAAEFKL
jgi:6-phosphofructokinase 1